MSGVTAFRIHFEPTMSQFYDHWRRGVKRNIQDTLVEYTDGRGPRNSRVGPVLLSWPSGRDTARVPRARTLPTIHGDARTDRYK